MWERSSELVIWITILAYAVICALLWMAAAGTGTL